MFRVVCAVAVLAAHVLVVASPGWATASLPVEPVTVWALTPSSPVHGENLVLSVDGSVQRVLRPAPGVSSLLGGEMSWSPDGRRYAVVLPNPDNTPSETQEPWDVFVLDAVTGAGVAISNTPLWRDTNPRWSPRGDWILWTTNNTLYIARPDGSERRVVASGYSVSGAGSFSPDGTRIAYTIQYPYDGSPSSCIWVQTRIVNIDGTNDRPLTSGCKQARYPEWSPDGQRLSYIGNYIYDNRWVDAVVSSRLDGSDVRVVVAHDAPHGFAHGPARWSPDGNWLLINFFHDGLRDLGLVAVVGSEFVPIPNPAGHARIFGYWETPNAVDQEPPSTQIIGAKAWSNLPLTLTLEADDLGGSGVAATYFQVDGGLVQTGATITIAAPVDHANDGVHTIRFYSTDRAGNIEPPRELVVGIDTRAPTISSAATPEGTNGWWQTPVTVGFTCTDDRSGIELCSEDVLVAEEGIRTIEGVGQDAAGNSARTTVELKIDFTGPTIVCPTPEPSFLLNSSDAVLVGAVHDALSGVASGSASVAVSTATVGLQTTTLGAGDIAGNRTTASCSYRVEYQTTAFEGSVEPPPHENVATAGQSVPVRWRLTTATGDPISDPSSFVSISSHTTSCYDNAHGEIVEPAAGGSGLRYLGDGWWQYNWNTSRTYAGQCRTITLNLSDGGTGPTALFHFR